MLFLYPPPTLISFNHTMHLIILNVTSRYSAFLCVRFLTAPHLPIYLRIYVLLVFLKQSVGFSLLTSLILSLNLYSFSCNLCFNSSIASFIHLFLRLYFHYTSWYFQFFLIALLFFPLMIEICLGIFLIHCFLRPFHQGSFNSLSIFCFGLLFVVLYILYTL